MMAVLKTNRSQKLFVGFLMYPSSVVGSDVLNSRNLNSLPVSKLVVCKLVNAQSLFTCCLVLPCMSYVGSLLTDLSLK